jgi:hypothetical protein
MEATSAMLADAASVSGGKLYVHGGAWDRLTVQGLPATHPSLALVLVLRIEYSEALRDIHVRVQLLDEDDNSVGPTVDGTINVGHPPGTRPGTPAFVPHTLTFNGLEFRRTGGYRFKVMEGDRELASVPFQVVSR